MTVVRTGSASDVGRVRTSNEDRALVTDSLFAVADGMGGHVGGEVAARVAVGTLQQTFEQAPSAEGLLEAIVEANRAVWSQSQEQHDLRGMGTTLTAAALVPSTDGDGDVIALANVGDSRAYVVGDGQMIQVTADHSLAEERVRQGVLTEQEAAVHPHRHILTRALGIGPGVDVDLWELKLQTGDRLLLCSDGLTNEVPDERIAQVLRENPDPEGAAEALVEEANRHGGNDNITVVVVDVVVGERGPTSIEEGATVAAVPLADGALDGGPASEAGASQPSGSSSPTDSGGGPDGAAGPDGAGTEGHGRAATAARRPRGPGDARSPGAPGAPPDVPPAPPAAGGPSSHRPAGPGAEDGPRRGDGTRTMPRPGDTTAVPVVGAPGTTRGRTATPSGGQSAGARGRVSQLATSSGPPTTVGAPSPGGAAGPAVAGAGTATILRPATAPEVESRREAKRRLRRSQPRRLTLRVVLFVLILAAVIAAGYFVLRWYATGSYYVTVNRGALVIYQGRPGGILWFHPQLVRRTHVTTADILAVDVPTVRGTVTEPSERDAQRYIDNLRQEAIDQRRVASGTTPGSATTTTVPVAIVPTTAPPATAPVPPAGTTGAGPTGAGTTGVSGQ